MAAKTKVRLVRIRPENLEKLADISRQMHLQASLTELANLAMKYGMEKLRSVLLPSRK